MLHGPLPAPSPVPALVGWLGLVAPETASRVATVLGGARALVRYLSVHTGIPALLVAAVLVAVGYRVLKRSARFALEVALVAAALLAGTELGLITW